MRLLRAFFIAILIIGLTACGGGGGDESTQESDSNAIGTLSGKVTSVDGRASETRRFLPLEHRI